MTFTTELVATQQGRLADLGFYTGLIDGEEGPLTRNSMRDFKRTNGLSARPFPGPLTMSALWHDDAKPRPKAVATGTEPLWLAEARRLLGTREVPGAGNNPVIMQWARDLDQWYTGDDVPWCGLFVGHCMKVGAPNEPQNFNRLGARAWGENYGVDAGGPMLGAVCSLWRTHKTKSWNGHVFIVTGISGDAVRGIGGNQSDNVTESWFDLGRVLNYRLPDGVKGVPAPRAKTGTLSTNEA